MRCFSLATIAALLCLHSSQAFAPHTRIAVPSTPRNPFSTSTESSSSSSPTALRMGLDLVTYLRTEWVSAALCTNQTPRAADVCLQIGTQDGRAIVFVPRTIREFITSSAEADGTINTRIRRQLKQQAERRSSATIKYVDQRGDDLKETADESVDVVISLQAAAVLQENGMDWKRSVREAARVLKPGGRFLFVEQTEVNGESYLEYIMGLTSWTDEDQAMLQAKAAKQNDSEEDEDNDDEEIIPVFDDVGYDDVDMVITPHVAGVAVKSLEAGMSAAERAAKAKQEEQQVLAEKSLVAFERGLKKRKRKKKKTEEEAKA